MPLSRNQRIAAILKSENMGALLTVKGWVRSLRVGKDIAFIAINDGSAVSSLQVVVESGIDAFDAVSRLGTGSAIAVEGRLVPSPATGQAVEMKAEKIVVYGIADDSYPLQKKRHSFEYLRTIAHLRPRTNTFGAVFRLRSSLAHAVHRFFAERGFLYVHTPIITASDCEGAGEMFRVTTLDPRQPPLKDGAVDFGEDFFATATSLTVSGQLEGELFAQAFGDIYTFGPTFRAENSNTARHAAEFWMIEPEMAFADLMDDAALAEEFFRYLCRHALENCSEDMAFFDAQIEKGLLERLRSVAETDFSMMEYTEAVRRLEAAPVSFQFPVAWGVDLQSEHERYLTEKVVGGPVFIVNYPKDIKAFYMRQNDDGRTVAAMDLLVPRVGEIIGGSQREERSDLLRQKMQTVGIDPAALWWYLDSRRWGATP
ncbi:MAG: asparagine--tRNA ligase, partial [Geobacter sp.]|nr:asparagine--tRNA ligase [Geobacter sp.]